MLQRLKNRTHGDEGFTLVELLVVILIIGILAAIALPTFLGQSAKGQDSSAKSNARNAVSAMESCAADNGGSYATCNTAALKTIETGLPWQAGSALAAEEVAVTSVNGTTGYVITAKSKSTNDFLITKSSGDPPVVRSCVATKAGAGCPTSLRW